MNRNRYGFPYADAVKEHDRRVIGEIFDNIRLQDEQQRKDENLSFLVALAVVVGVILMFVLFIAGTAHADTIPLKASWYSVDSLKKEGTWKTSKGIMANGKMFDENKFTCASRLFPLGSVLRITNRANNRSVCVRVTDKIGKRFARSRVDLSRAAFQKIASLKQGLVSVEVEEVR